MATINDVLRRLDELDLASRLDRIEEQVRATNGRVTALELARERQKGFVSAFKWAPSVVASLITAGVLGVVALVVH